MTKNEDPMESGKGVENRGFCFISRSNKFSGLSRMSDA